MDRTLRNMLITGLLLVIFTASTGLFPAESPVFHQGGENEADVKVPVLMYHHLLKSGENKRYKGNEIVVTVENFQKQMDYLHDNGYHTVTLSELSRFLYHGGTLPEKPVLITFDDGYYSNYQYAYPILRQYGYTAVVFLVTSKITDEQAPFDPNAITMLSWPVVEKSRDVFEYEAHTHALHEITQNGRSRLTDSSYEGVLKDLGQSLEHLENKAFSYPYGFYNDTVIKALQEKGFELAFTVRSGYVKKGSDPYQLPRFNIRPNCSLESFIGIVNGSWVP
ncbi:polysaccharide deacetylase family protein [Gehongia tenuis]|uniref:Polysaccharide deacetylase family protein n=1 Tax=Gehongia tenuis TaxID=2763655 RepID=A0A926HQ35_9FIRM|nr:polysaccharide deacetylase family protein [Gehongia tenuis]MBC8531335.1 polysaccharide deacetylase family protein [Gehongia tenuis]